VLAYFRQDLLQMAFAAPRVLSTQQDEPARMAWLIVIGTIPVVIVGLLLRNVEDALRRPAVVGVTLAVGGLLLLWAEWASSRVRQAEDLGTGEAFSLGWAQSAALVPGVSRSGATLTLALFLGLRRDAAARFSFLLGVPAIAAAAAHEGLKVLREPLADGAAQLFLIGIAVSAIVGYITITYFLRYLASHSLWVFAWYRIALSVAVAVWLMAGLG
jgi:undecaprenyl-diphosphatase